MAVRVKSRRIKTNSRRTRRGGSPPDKMKTLHIPKGDQYTAAGLDLFQYAFHGSNGHTDLVRDLYKDVNELSTSMLKNFAKEIGIPNYSKMKKGELKPLVKSHIVFE
jgi:Rho termination factor, N-terminal domain